MNKNLKFLVIEDEDSDVDLLNYDLNKSFEKDSFKIIHARTLANGVELALENNFDAIFLDLNLPDSYGIKAVTKIRNTVPDTILYAISGFECEEKTKEVESIGAKRYLVKGDFDSKLIFDDLKDLKDKRSETVGL